MTHPLAPLPPGGPRLPSAPIPAPPSPAATGGLASLPSSPTPHAPAASFAARLASVAARLEGQEREVDRRLRAIGRGRELSNAELIALQAGVYRYAQGLELTTRVVDKAAGALRQTLEAHR